MPNLNNLLAASGNTPAGAVMSFAMSAAPMGWYPCDGTTITRTGSGANLFAAIGTTYGSGNGTTTFNVPDLRGIFVRGSGSQTINTVAYTGTFATKQNDEFKSHTHVLHGQASTGGAGGQITRLGDRITSFESDARGGDETRPANIALFYCIKL